MPDHNAIDFHTHILPQIDDGSPKDNLSVDMLRWETEQGGGRICGTSHYDAGLPQIIPETETDFFSGISECAVLEQLRIQTTRNLMLEMPFTEWHRFRTVLIHPERFHTSRENRQKLRKLEGLQKRQCYEPV